MKISWSMRISARASATLRLREPSIQRTSTLAHAAFVCDTARAVLRAAGGRAPRELAAAKLRSSTRSNKKTHGEQKEEDSPRDDEDAIHPPCSVSKYTCFLFVDLGCFFFSFFLSDFFFFGGEEDVCAGRKPFLPEKESRSKSSSSSSSSSSASFLSSPSPSEADGGDWDDTEEKEEEFPKMSWSESSS